jgi:hypothetical protein
LDIAIHNKVTTFYRSEASPIKGKTVREWLKGKSWKKQYEFGLKAIEDVKAQVIKEQRGNLAKRSSFDMNRPKQ